MIMQTSKGNWKIFGIGMTTSDCNYSTIKSAIETGVGLDQTSLQRSIGYRAPIKVDKSAKTIQFFKS